MTIEQLKQRILDLQAHRAQARHPSGSPEDERQRGEINAFNMVLAMLNNEELTA